MACAQLRATLALVLLAHLAPRDAVAAQGDGPRLLPIRSPVRDGGVLHLATGTWTRNVPHAALGTAVVYDNTCPSPFYRPLEGDRFVDEGRLPSPSSPDRVLSKPGTQTRYTIDGFQIGYCTDGAFGSATVRVNFYETYVACGSVTGVPPTASLALVGLPGSSAFACWTVTIDLDSPPQSASLAFDMQADGNGTYTNGTADLFGWSMECDAPDASQAASGPLVAGNPNACPSWDGTAWDPVIDYAEAGTGMSTVDAYRVENGPTPPGCDWGGPPHFRSFHLELYSDVACLTQFGPGTVFCCGDGTGTQCPCGNNSPVVLPGRCSGCGYDMYGRAVRLRAFGGNAQCQPVPAGGSISADDIVLEASYPGYSSALFFQGTLRENGGSGAAFGDGLRCAAGTIRRLGVEWASTPYVRYPGPGDPPISVQGQITAPGTRTYQAWFRVAASFCTPATFNLTNGYEIAWGA